ncbi:radical SAM protein [Azospirillum palustre]|nr:radical SAM protein [Azospirillum palustre]
MQSQRCNAPWYELNISCPDERVSCCCYYNGPIDPYKIDEKNVDAYWNSHNMQRVRELNSSVDSDEKNGCSNCFYFNNFNNADYFSGLNPDSPPRNMSDLQRKNWELSVSEYAAGRTSVESRPMLYYFNFGFACNLSCIQCIQVPYRTTNKKQLKAETLFSWKDAFRSALEVRVIGGEVFVLPEAIKFIRWFIDQDDLEDVTLGIITNGSLLHKHLNTLKRKRKLVLSFSLDSVGESYEEIRTGGVWKQVAENIAEFLSVAQEEGREWSGAIGSGLMRTGLRHLPDLAAWAMDNRMGISFFEVGMVRGNEAVIEHESYLWNPLVLDHVPNWSEKFDQAIDIFRTHGHPHTADTLGIFQKTLHSKIERARREASDFDRWEAERETVPLFDLQPTQDSIHNLMPVVIGDALEKVLVPGPAGLCFRPTKLYDHLATEFVEIERNGDRQPLLRLTVEWPADVKPADQCWIMVQDQNFNYTNGVHQETHVGETVRLEKRIRLKDHVRRVRLILYGNEQEAKRLPLSVKVMLSP